MCVLVLPDKVNPQGWNRYSYVGNDPLAFTDPNGFSWLSGFFHSVGSFFSSVFNFLKQNILSIAQIAITAVLTPLVGPILAAAAGAAIIIGISGGSLSQALRAGLIAGVTAAAFFGVGEMTNALANYNPVGDMPAHIQPAFGTDVYAFNVAGHALVGCASSAASGGSCQSGALAAGLSAAAGPAVNKMNGVAALTANSVVGGVGSVAGGGKSANGAVTGAFGYLFNSCAGNCWGAFKDAASMAIDWALGVGPANRTFGQGTIQVADMADAPGVNEAREYFYQKNAAAISSGGPLQPVTNYRAGFGLWDLLTTSSPTQQFVGSYAINVSPVSNGLEFTLTNNSSFTSFAYGKMESWERSSFGPGGNMRQTYTWREPMISRWVLLNGRRSRAKFIQLGERNVRDPAWQLT